MKRSIEEISLEQRHCTLCALWSTNLRMCLVENIPETCEFVTAVNWKKGE